MNVTAHVLAGYLVLAGGPCVEEGGTCSGSGCSVAALFYSLIETAKLCGVEPKGYLLRATSEALDHPGAVTLPAT